MLSKNYLNEVKQLQKVAGILREDDDFNLSDNPFKIRKYYAIVNYGQDNQYPPVYFTVNGGKKLITILNQLHEKLTKDRVFYYTEEDLEPKTFMGEDSPTLINDDWATVTDNEEYFKEALKQFRHSEIIKIDPIAFLNK